MKLISLADRVDQLRNQFGDKPLKMWSQTFTKKVIKYTDFINQSLWIWMFVPAIQLEDGTWEVLELPLATKHKGSIDDFGKKVEQYAKAKDKVLFEGFEIKWSKSQLDGKEFFGVTLNGQWCGSYNNFVETYLRGIQKVEGLCFLKDELKPTLTTTALKMIGDEA